MLAQWTLGVVTGATARTGISLKAIVEKELTDFPLKKRDVEERGIKDISTAGVPPARRSSGDHRGVVDAESYVGRERKRVPAARFEALSHTHMPLVSRVLLVDFCWTLKRPNWTEGAFVCRGTQHGARSAAETGMMFRRDGPKPCM